MPHGGTLGSAHAPRADVRTGSRFWWLAPGRLLWVLAPLLPALIMLHVFLTLSEGRRLEQHSHRVLDAIGVAIETLNEAQIGQLGYLLSGSEAELPRFQQALTRLTPALAAVQQLTAGNPRQHAAMAATAPMTDAALAVLASGVSHTQRHGVNAAFAAGNLAEGERVIARARAALQAFAIEARRELDERTAATARAERMLGAGSLFCAALSVVAAMLGFRRRRGDRRGDRRG